MYKYLGTDSPLSCSADLMKMEFLYVRSASLQVDNLMRFIAIQVHQQGLRLHHTTSISHVLQRNALTLAGRQIRRDNPCRSMPRVDWCPGTRHTRMTVDCP